MIKQDEIGASLKSHECDFRSPDSNAARSRAKNGVNRRMKIIKMSWRGLYYLQILLLQIKDAKQATQRKIHGLGATQVCSHVAFRFRDESKTSNAATLTKFYICRKMLFFSYLYYCNL